MRNRPARRRELSRVEAQARSLINRLPSSKNVKFAPPDSDSRGRVSYRSVTYSRRSWASSKQPVRAAGLRCAGDRRSGAKLAPQRWDLPRPPEAGRPGAAVLERRNQWYWRRPGHRQPAQAAEPRNVPVPAAVLPCDVAHVPAPGLTRTGTACATRKVPTRGPACRRQQRARQQALEPRSPVSFRSSRNLPRAIDRTCVV